MIINKKTGYGCPLVRFLINLIVLHQLSLSLTLGGTALADVPGTGTDKDDGANENLVWGPVDWSHALEVIGSIGVGLAGWVGTDAGRGFVAGTRARLDAYWLIAAELDLDLQVGLVTVE